MTDSDLTKELDIFREEVRRFIADEYDPHLVQGPFPQNDTPRWGAFLRKLAAKGWLGISWPKEYGGLGLDFVYQLVLREELEYMGLPTLAKELIVGRTLMQHGSEELKTNFLPRLVRGDLTVALGYSEPEAGSDLASLQLKAESDGDEFVVNGQKMWTSGAHFADVIWLACRTDTAAAKHKGISIFIVDRTSPGIEIAPIWTMSGERTNMVFFDDVRIPGSRLVGELNQGWTYITQGLEDERLGGFPFGAFQRDLDEFIAWARENAWSSGEARRTVAEAAIRVEAARTHRLRALELLSRGAPSTIDAPMLKIALTEGRQWIADQVIDTLGPIGLLTGQEPDAPMAGRFELNWRCEIVSTIAGGANQIQRNIIARHHLGLPQH